MKRLRDDEGEAFIRNVVTAARNHPDNLMKMFIGSQPGFYESYQSAREIVDR
ncbi:MAG: hypothetical protein K9I68_05250 [Bacteroidales bacterium]|nr:hypothetical protein [Bacteroidales bacterium]MCF8337683.1 hypothetical protein [Bacteroidales bacterium]